MIAKNIASKVTLALAVAAVAIPMSNPAMAGGYGYGTQSGWSGYQTHAPKRQNVQRPVYAGSNRHLAWCFDRYRSYRLMDNSFQPYHGPRQECLSPYEQERRALFVGYPGEAPEILFRHQAGADPNLAGRDAFGNLPEGGPTEPVAVGNTGAADTFGNLPEQAAVRDAVLPAADNRPVTASTPPSVSERTAAAAEPDLSPAAAEAAPADAPLTKAKAPATATVPAEVANREPATD